MHPKVVSALNASSILYSIHRHADLPIPIHSPQDFARALGYSIERITKSVLLSSEPEKTYSLAVCSIDRKMNLKLLAELTHSKRVHLANAEELQNLTDYPSRGVSPLGLTDIPVYLDEQLLSLSTVLIGAGEVGVEIELSPIDLVTLSQANVVQLTQISTQA